MSTKEFSNLGKSEDTWTFPSCSKLNNSSTKVYFIPSGDDSKHASLNISTNLLLLDSISDSSIPSTSGSSINSTSFNTTSFSADIPITTSSPKPAITKPTPKKELRLLNNKLPESKKKGQYPTRTSQAFLDTIADNGLGQIVDFSTRKENTLDLMLTAHPSFKLRCKPLLDMACKPLKPKPVRRKIYLWKKKTEICKIKEYLETFKTSFKNISDRTVESIWQSFKSEIKKTIEKRVPTKKTQGRHTHP
ncbi:unnamed protein product [Mytilus coruscus]|uniref:BEN domain-containing protein n=1 Tax=Mytilus coruscus TaxID=42192 RepID=A0A6J8CJW5_MYTCO|nr:unnamed protein product [Mytilus coruscus]